MPALRIVSLVPSLTELAVHLGLGPALVGRTGFCIHPAEVVRVIPKVGGTKDVQIDRIRALAPTHVLVNVDENTAPVVDALRGFVPHIVVTHPCAPVDNLALYEQMASAFGDVPGVRERAAALAAALRQRLQDLARHPWPPRRVLYVIWREPWMTVARDTYISRLLACVGWHTWPAQEGGPKGAARYPVVDGQAVREVSLDAVLLSSEPYRFQPRHLAEWRALCPDAAVRLVDGERLSWYGSRAIAGLDYVRALAEGGAMRKG